MRELYKAVDMILDSLDFERIWPGFTKCNFALYNDNGVYFREEAAQYDQRFLGNTSIEYNGEFIAIWRVDNPTAEDPQLLAADLVHEMFHAFQSVHNESRWPNDLLMLDYPENMDNFALRYSENLLLAHVFLADDTDSKKNFLHRFMSARKYREGVIGDIIKQEYYTETVEGLADYAGSMALKQLSQEKYTGRINSYVEHLQNLDGRFFDIRRMLYFTGALFCIALSEAGMDFHHEIGVTTTPLFCIAAQKSMLEKPSIAFDASLLAAETEQYLHDKRLKLAEFIKTHNERVEGNFTICGYDPMNMVKQDDMILCSHFIMLKDERDDETVFIQGPVAVCLKQGSVNQVSSYIK